MLPLAGAALGGGLKTSNVTAQTAESTGRSDYVVDNTFVVGGQASVDKGDTGFGGASGSNSLAVLGIGGAVVLLGLVILKRL